MVEPIIAFLCCFSIESLTKMLQSRRRRGFPLPNESLRWRRSRPGQRETVPDRVLKSRHPSRNRVYFGLSIFVLSRISLMQCRLFVHQLRFSKALQISRSRPTLSDLAGVGNQVSHPVNPPPVIQPVCPSVFVSLFSVCICVSLTSMSQHRHQCFSQENL